MAYLYGKDGRSYMKSPRQQRSLRPISIKRSSGSGKPYFERNGVIKSLMIAFLIIFLWLIYTSSNARDIPMTEISSYMKSNTTVASLQERGRADLKRFYSLDDAQTDGYIFYKAISPMSVNEMLIVKASSAGQAAGFAEAAAAHLESQKTVFGSYGTDQMALLNAASVGSKGRYVYYFCGPEADIWYDTFLSLI